MMLNDHLLRLYIASSALRFPIRPVSMQSVMLMNTIKHYCLRSINNLKVSQLTFLMIYFVRSWYFPDKLWLLLLWPIWCFNACISWLLPLSLEYLCHESCNPFEQLVLLEIMRYLCWKKKLFAPLQSLFILTFDLLLNTESVHTSRD